ncbi:MAG: TonB-dependent receptor [Desulfobacterales bacterium]|nr:TonB-dependent receptor [Desulfobacterales bacterium]
MMKRLGCLFALVLFVQITGISLYQIAAQEEQPVAQEEDQLVSPEGDIESLEDIFEAKESEEEYYKTDRVLMTATKHLMDARKAPAIASVITEQEIRNMGGRNLMDILRKIPGLGTRRRLMFDSVGMRGINTANTEKVLLLIDGHRMNGGYDGSAIPYLGFDLMAEDIKRLEVVRGPGSALYGANAFVGVINVITKKAEDIDGQQFSATSGSFNTQHYNGLLSHKGDNFQISAHVDYYDSDGQALPVESDYQTIQDGLKGTKASLAPGNTHEFSEKWDTGFNMKYGDFRLTGRVIDKEYGPLIGVLGALNDETVQKLTQMFGDLFYKKSITDDLDASVRVYADHWGIDILYEALPEGFTVGGNDKGYLGGPVIKINTYGAEITTDYVLGDHLITIGANYEYIDQYEAKAFNNIWSGFSSEIQKESLPSNKEVTREVIAGYFQYMWEMSAYDSLTIGVRYDHYDDFGSTINPRAGFVHEFQNGLIAKILYGSAFRAPSFIELYVQNNPTTLGNPDLDPEKINTYELGLEYSFLKYYSLTLSYFHNELEDLIDRKESPTFPWSYHNKDGKTTVDGAEAELHFQFAKDRYGYINCSYQYGTDEQDRSIPEVPHWRANTGLNFGLSKYFNTNLNVSWIGERKRAEGDVRGEKLSSETLVDLTLIAKGFYKNFEIRGSVYNLFDETYKDPWPSMVIPNDIPGYERMFLVEARYKF